MPESARFEILCQRKFFFVFGVDGWLYWLNKPTYFGDALSFGQILNNLIVPADDGRV